MKALTILLAFFAMACAGWGQPFDIEQHRVAMTVLDGPWRFQAGDDPAWAQPGFNDSRWPLLRTDKSWTEQGFAGYSGIAWYRQEVTLPNRTEPMALFVPAAMDSYEVYANGQLVGHFGTMPPKRSFTIVGRRLFSLPGEVARPGRPLLIAIRMWHWPSDAVIFHAGLMAPPVIGEAGLLTMVHTLMWRSDFWEATATSLNVFANGLTAIAGLALFALRRKEREYLWYGVAQVFWTLMVAMRLVLTFHSISLLWGDTTLICAAALGMLFNIEFFVTLLGQRKGMLYWTAVGSVALMLAAIPALFWNLNYSTWNSGAAALELVYGLCVPAMLFLGARRGSMDAKLLVVPFTLSFACNVLNNLVEIPAVLRQPGGRWLAQHMGELFSQPFPVNAAIFFGDVAMFSVMAVLVLRYARSRRDEERLEAELEAARAVQNVLIPEEIPSIPGLRVDCVYKPAGEVGGDFFQILPLTGGGALLAIGDVSGKGMPAAMTVSLLVGMVRMLARSTQSPAAILTAINQSVIGRSAGSFTTCLMLSIDGNGEVTAANAGHLAPYVNGREVTVENGMPLGLIATATYTETTFSLGNDDQLTLLTDGVPEARNAEGELFGFERAASMSHLPAAEIARAAQQFGQTDDITVLSVRRESSRLDAKPILTSSAWTPTEA